MSTHPEAAEPRRPDVAVREIERAILTGRRGVEGEPGVVTAEDVEALRAVLAAPLDRATAEALFDIAHATATARNDPAFAEVFATALGGYLAAAAPALAGLAGALLAEARAGVDRLGEDRYGEASAESEARLAAAARIEAGEAQWVLAPLARGGALSPAERRLLALLRGPARLDHAA